MSEGVGAGEIRLADVTLREASLVRVRMSGAYLEDVEVDGLVNGLVINGVDVGPLVQAELERRHPERRHLRSESAEGLLDGWDWLRTAWAATTERIRQLPDDAVRMRVDGEWSALETLRHLVFVHDVWFSRAVRGHDRVHALGLAPHVGTGRELGLDPEADPSLADVLNVRQQQLDAVERLLASADEELLDSPALALPSWADRRPATVRACLHVLMSEEWEHRRFCERDLGRLPGRLRPSR